MTRTGICEGIAVLLSEAILKNKKENADIFWFGFINKNLREKWLLNCENKVFTDFLIFKEDVLTEKLEQELLSLEDFSENSIVNGRRVLFRVYFY